MTACVRRRAFHIATILKVGDAAQISQTIVGFIPINVIHIHSRLWPKLMRNCPCHAMRGKLDIHDATSVISVRRFRSESFRPCITGIPNRTVTLSGEHLARPHLPKQLTCLGLIAKQLAAKFGRDIGSFSHGEDPFRSGQGRAALQPLFRSVFLSIISVFSKHPKASTGRRCGSCRASTR